MNLNPINYYNPIIAPDQNPTSAILTMSFHDKERTKTINDVYMSRRNSRIIRLVRELFARYRKFLQQQVKREKKGLNFYLPVPSSSTVF
jgi:hypothetical protein